jgi:hypothetical protein
VSDPSAELPPPRYEQVGNWKHLICDEQEWLARPASWGIEKLPDEHRARKQNAYNANFFGWMAGFITCAECRAVVLRAFADDSNCFDIAPFEEWNVELPHPECDGRPFRRIARHGQRGLVTQTEVFNQTLDELFTLFVGLGIAEKSPRFGLLRQAKDRELALELVGPNPFRPIAFDPAWRTDTAVALARQMYESREFGAMPILADALQDAGCDSEPILMHCRDPHAAHVRGCWVCDLVLFSA